MMAQRRLQVVQQIQLDRGDRVARHGDVLQQRLARPREARHRGDSHRGGIALERVQAAGAAEQRGNVHRIGPQRLHLLVERIDQAAGFGQERGHQPPPPLLRRRDGRRFGDAGRPADQRRRRVQRCEERLVGGRQAGYQSLPIADTIDQRRVGGVQCRQSLLRHPVGHPGLSATRVEHRVEDILRRFGQSGQRQQPDLPAVALDGVEGATRHAHRRQVPAVVVQFRQGGGGRLQHAQAALAEDSDDALVQPRSLLLLDDLRGGGPVQREAPLERGGDVRPRLRRWRMLLGGHGRPIRLGGRFGRGDPGVERHRPRRLHLLGRLRRGRGRELILHAGGEAERCDIVRREAQHARDLREVVDIVLGRREASLEVAAQGSHARHQARQIRSGSHTQRSAHAAKGDTGALGQVPDHEIAEHPLLGEVQPDLHQDLGYLLYRRDRQGRAGAADAMRVPIQVVYLLHQGVRTILLDRHAGQAGRLEDGGGSAYGP